jgi:hypothetical protein
MLLIRKRSSIWGYLRKFAGFFMFLGVEIHSIGLNKAVLNGTFLVYCKIQVPFSGRIV